MQIFTAVMGNRGDKSTRVYFFHFQLSLTKVYHNKALNIL